MSSVLPATRSSMSSVLPATMLHGHQFFKSVNQSISHGNLPNPCLSAAPSRGGSLSTISMLLVKRTPVPDLVSKATLGELKTSFTGVGLFNDDDSARSTSSSRSASSYRLEPVKARGSLRIGEPIEDDPDPLQELFSGQHILWKTRQRLHVRISLCAHGSVLMLEVEVEDDLTEKEKLPRVFCDVRTLRQATDAAAKANFATQLSTRTCRGETLSNRDQSLMQEEVQRASFVTFLLRRIAISQQQARGAESRRSSVCAGETAKKETVQIRLNGEDLVSVEDLVLQDGDSRIPPMWWNDGALPFAALKSHTQRLRRESFVSTKIDMDDSCGQSKAAREEGTGIRTEAMDNLTQVLIQEPPASWFKKQQDLECSLLKRAKRRIVFRLNHAKMLKQLLASKNYALFVVAWEVRSKQLAEEEAVKQLAEEARIKEEEEQAALAPPRGLIPQLKGYLQPGTSSNNKKRNNSITKVLKKPTALPAAASRIVPSKRHSIC